MTETIRHMESQLIDDDIYLSLTELCRSCSMQSDTVEAWVFEGVLRPQGEQPQEWRFNGTTLRRAKLAQQLSQDLEINTPGIALALDLLERIEMLQAELTRLSHFHARS
jgi:chaperone modulatory protein CbpM